MQKSRLVLLLIIFPIFAWAQLVRVPLIRSAEPKKKNPSARTESLTPMKLPFWDDFSFSNSDYYSYDSLWENSHSAWVNDGVGINPPTLRVATFDGLDSLGKPYSVNDVSAKGYADKMISRPLQMDLVTGTRRDSVYIFFMYQFQGHGEPPDPGDVLSLWLKSNDNQWTNIWSVSADTLSNDSVFIPVKIPITDSKYFFGNFQFQFRNIGRLSGPFDGWNIDYVFVSNGRKQHAPIYPDFPDRAIINPMTSLFKQYRSLPAKHFLESPTGTMAQPWFLIRNMRPDGLQPTDFDSRYRLATRVSKVVSVGSTTTLQLAADHQEVPGDVVRKMTLGVLPDVSAIDVKADSIAIKLQIQINSGDNVEKIPDSFDFDSLAYKGIDFRHNDTTSTNFILRNYYAYDDGVAEYAAALTNPGNKVLYRYDVKYSQPDTLIAVDIYFTHSGDESSQVVKLLLMDSLRDDITIFYPPQDVVVTRTEKNKFTRVTLSPAVLVSDHFYIGWQQNTFGNIGVGLDYSSDSGNKIWVNFAGTWVPNEDVHGNLMIRPVFGNEPLVVTAVAREKNLHLYPNPNSGSFYLEGNPSQILITDITGRQISFLQENEFDKTQIHLSSTNPGIYVLKYFDSAQWRTEKIIVHP